MFNREKEKRTEREKGEANLEKEMQENQQQDSQFNIQLSQLNWNESMEPKLPTPSISLPTPSRFLTENGIRITVLFRFNYRLD